MAKPSNDKNEEDGSRPKVGTLLQASRQHSGQDLADVALMLRIRLPYLVAIEAGQYRELPGATYAVGFIRAYAEHLGLDSDEVVRLFKEESIDGGSNQKLSFPTPVPETGIPGGAVVFVGIVVAVLAYGAWYLSTTEDGFVAELVSPLDEQLSSLISGDEAKVPDAEPQQPDQDATEPVAEVPSSEEPEPVTETPSEITEPPQPETTASVETQGNGEASPEPSAQTEDMAVSPSDTPDDAASEAEANPEISAEVAAESPQAPQADVPQEPVEAASAEPEVSVPGVVEAVPAMESEPKPEAISTPEPSVVAESVPVETPVETADAAPAPTQESEAEPVSRSADVSSQPSPAVAAETEPASVAVSVSGATGTESEIAAVLPTASPQAPVVASAVASSEVVSGGSSRITINALSNSWIQVRDDVANTMLVTRLLSAGGRYEVPDQPGLVLLTGNAGALEILVDGEVVPSIGGTGVVRRDVILEVERLKSGTAVGN